MTEWILPTNPARFRTDDALRELGKIEWYQNKSIINMQTEDIVYLYVSSPVRELHWKCRTTAVKRMTSLIDDTVYHTRNVSSEEFVGPFVELEVIYEFTLTDLVTFDNLKENELKNRLMGPCRVNQQLSQYLSAVEGMEQDEQKTNAYLSSLPSATLLRLANQHSGIPVQHQTFTRSYSRNPYIAQYAKRRAKGCCQLCGKAAPFKDGNGDPYLEAHHVVWLSKGEIDSIDNTVALCPNCHRKMHVVNDLNDVARLKTILITA